jgi:hypothetical protein
MQSDSEMSHETEGEMHGSPKILSAMLDIFNEII